MSADEAIRVEDLVCAFPGGRRAVDGVAFRVGRGESVGLIGPNGAGKTTLIRLVGGLLRPSEGHVAIFGDPFDGRGDRALRRRIGIVFQETEDQLFSPTVLDDVAFGPLQCGCGPEDSRRRALDALTRVGLEDFDGRSPHQLSAGEKRRVALAGVLAYDPEILILDEPTSDLDPRERRRLIELLTSTSQARLVASHDFEFILRTCARVIVLDRGRLVAEGDAAEVLSDHALLARHGLEAPLGLRHLDAQGLRRLLAEVR